MKYIGSLCAAFVLVAGGWAKPFPTPPAGREGPPTLIYKTRRDYRNFVPVLLSPDKTAIIAYPAPADVYYQGRLALPTILKKGYLLDNRGISPQVAFLDITYPRYARLPEPPTVAMLKRHILDKDPLLVLYDCGPRDQFTHVVADLNRAILRRQLSAFRKIR